MDSLTQIVLGAAVGEAVLGRKIGNKAMLYGAIAGTIPDLDVLARNFVDTITATEAHRGFSHSILFCVLVAPIFGWLVNKIEVKKKLGWKPWAWLFFWGFFTHPLLDCFTTWGTQLFWPFDWRIAFNSIFVIDPLYTIPFMVCVIWAMFLKRTSSKRRKINWAGIMISSTYLALTVVLKLVATQKFKDRLDSQNIEYKEISTRPAAFNTILWNSNVETANSYLLGDYSFFDTQPIKFDDYPKNRRAEPVYESAQAREDLERLKDIAQGWYLMENKDGQWYFYDLRFGLRPVNEEEEAFVFAYIVEEGKDGLIVNETEKNLEDAGLIFSQLWQRTQGN
ncbi:inner membrane protein [Nonlabens sp. Hel1_33_55]|uniref:metal-dependent hydrolase n=1 Tax=Nonlabens sp. Hel1_33_55 TaxID=1336802 RepID=UPI000875E794|nr:metal-dependent hydrolase [Nonlabens sp. Hel1_33_55]SCX90499.1 inner membrane protein [Nonlabens sp. Hel1_33_55]